MSIPAGDAQRNPYVGLRKKKQQPGSVASSGWSLSALEQRNIAEDLYKGAVVDKEVLKFKSVAVISNLRSKLDTTEKLLATARNARQEHEDQENAHDSKLNEDAGCTSVLGASSGSSYGKYNTQSPRNVLISTLQEECATMQQQIQRLVLLLEQKTVEVNASRQKFNSWLQGIQGELESHIEVVTTITSERDFWKNKAEELEDSVQEEQLLFSQLKESNESDKGAADRRIQELNLRVDVLQTRNEELQDQVKNLEQTLETERDTKMSLEGDFSEIRENLHKELHSIRSREASPDAAMRRPMTKSTAPDESDQFASQADLIKDLESRLSNSLTESASLIDGWARAQKEKELEIKSLHAILLGKDMDLEKSKVQWTQEKQTFGTQIANLEAELQEYRELDKEKEQHHQSGHLSSSFMHAAAEMGTRLRSEFSSVTKLVPLSTSKPRQDRSHSFAAQSSSSLIHSSPTKAAYAPVSATVVHPASSASVLQEVADSLTQEANNIRPRSISRANQWDMLANKVETVITVLAAERESGMESASAALVTQPALAATLAPASSTSSSPVRTAAAVESDLQASSPIHHELQEVVKTKLQPVLKLLYEGPFDITAVSEILQDVSEFLQSEASRIMGKSVSKASEFSKRANDLLFVNESVKELIQFVESMLTKLRSELQHLVGGELTQELNSKLGSWQLEWEGGLKSREHGSSAVKSGGLEAGASLLLLEAEQDVANEGGEEAVTVLLQSYSELLEEKQCVIEVHESALKEQESQFKAVSDELLAMKQALSAAILREIALQNESRETSMSLQNVNDENAGLRSQLQHWGDKFDDFVRLKESEVEESKKLSQESVKEKEAEIDILTGRIQQLTERLEARASSLAELQAGTTSSGNDDQDGDRLGALKAEDLVANVSSDIDVMVATDSGTEGTRAALMGMKSKLSLCSVLLREKIEETATQSMRIEALLRTKTQLQHGNVALTRKMEAANKQYTAELTTLTRLLTRSQQETNGLRSELNEQTRVADCALEDRESLQNYVSDIQAELDAAVEAQALAEQQLKQEIDALTSECEMLRSQLDQRVTTSNGNKMATPFVSARRSKHPAVGCTPASAGFSASMRLIGATGGVGTFPSTPAVHPSLGDKSAVLSSRLVCELRSKFNSLRKLTVSKVAAAEHGKDGEDGKGAATDTVRKQMLFSPGQGNNSVPSAVDSNTAEGPR
jgi:hypothetical protein